LVTKSDFCTGFEDDSKMKIYFSLEEKSIKREPFYAILFARHNGMAIFVRPK
jgi:hypothetical protein